MIKSLFSFVFFFFGFVFLVSCDLGDLRIFAQFDSLEGLASGDRILRDGQYIGDVEKTTRTDEGRYLVELDIDSEHRKKVTVHSIFYIAADPARPGRKAVFTEQEKPGGVPLNQDSVVAGSDPPYLRHMFDEIREKTRSFTDELADQLDKVRELYREKSPQLKKELENSLAEIDRKLRELEEEVKKAPESEEARRLKKNIDALVGKLATTLEEATIILSRDFVDRMKEDLADLRRRIEELSRENKRLEKQQRQDGNDVRI